MVKFAAIINYNLMSLYIVFNQILKEIQLKRVCCFVMKTY